MDTLNNFLGKLNNFLNNLNNFLNQLNNFLDTVNNFLGKLNNFLNKLNNFLDQLKRKVHSVFFSNQGIRFVFFFRAQNQPTSMFQKVQKCPKNSEIHYFCDILNVRPPFFYAIESSIFFEIHVQNSSISVCFWSILFVKTMR